MCIRDRPRTKQHGSHCKPPARSRRRRTEGPRPFLPQRSGRRALRPKRARHKAAASVSYTHLDVYKRQSLHGECHGLVGTVPGSDNRKLAQIDRPAVEQQYLSVQLLRGMIVRYVFDSHYLILAKTTIGLSSSFSQARAISFAIGDTGGCLW